MHQPRQTLRVGLTAILCALIFRLFATGSVSAWLKDPNTAAFFVYLETGRNVRFSPSLDTFSPDFMESPPPSLPEPTEPRIPSFSGEESVQLYYAAEKSPDIPTLLAKPLTWQLRGEEPTVLILHTHTTESYTKTAETYKESASWRTLDESYNMLAMGTLVAGILEQNGIPTLQDREIHDYPSYNGSYTHARKSLERYLEEYPSLCLILDLHRDASAGDGGQMRTKATVNGTPSAQLMLVLGTNHKAYEENLSIALKLHTLLEQQAPGITRPLQLRAQRFNQDLSPGALIVEVGAAGNTHAEAQTAAKQLAQAIVALANGTE